MNRARVEGESYEDYRDVLRRAERVMRKYLKGKPVPWRASRRKGLSKKIRSNEKRAFKRKERGARVSGSPS